MAEDNNAKQVKLLRQVKEICEQAVEQCHQQIFSKKKLSLNDLKSMMFIVREARFLSDERIAELSLEDLEKLAEAAAEDIDDDVDDMESGEDWKARKDDDPFGGDDE